MHNIIQNHFIIAVFIARIFLGFLFFFQGYDSIFRVGIKKAIEAFHIPFSDKGIPKFFSIIGVWFTSYIKLICGIMLIIGFIKYYALYMLGMDLILASIAFGIVRPMWDIHFVFPRLAVLVFLLIIPTHWDVLSVDYFWSFFKFLTSF